MASSFYSPARLTFVLLAALLIAGCGESQTDQLKRMMARKSGAEADAEGEDNKGANRKPVADAPPKDPAAPVKRGPTDKLSEKEEAIMASAATDDADFIAFRQRVLEQFAERARNMTHLEKLNRVGEAFAEMLRERQWIPNNGFPSARPALSWRVQLLPYLGYDELYSKFDLTRRFSSPINRRLMDLIPPEFQTCNEPGKTTIVLPVSSSTPFSPIGEGVHFSRVEDGIAETVMVVEVDDDHAQQWTAPEVFEVNKYKTTTGMGEKYGFIPVIFGDGRVEKAAKNVADRQFRALITHDAGDIYPFNTTQQVTQADFGLNGFGPKQQLVMMGAGGAMSMVGDLSSSVAVNSAPVDAAAGSEGGEPAAPLVSLPAKLTEASMTALKEGDMAAAFDYEYASLLVSGGSNFQLYGWSPVLQRPVLAARWSVGLLYPDRYEGKFDPPKRAQARNGGVKLPGEDLLEPKSGQIGPDALIVLRKLVTAGKFGRFLVDQIPMSNTMSSEERDRSRRRRRDAERDAARISSNQELFDSRKIPKLNFPGIEVDEGNTRAYHVKVARERGSELLLLIDIDLIAWGNDQNTQITTLYVIDADRGRELWKSAPLNTRRIREDRESALKEDAVFVELKDLERFCQENVALTELPQGLTREHVLKRLEVLAGRSDENKLPILAEGKFYLSRNLILKSDYVKFCGDVLRDQEKGVQLAVGSDLQKLEILKSYLPLRYSLELSQ